MTLELQLFASLADYAGDVWEIVFFFPCHVSGKATAAEGCRSILESILT